MKIDWDEEKNKINIQKHGYSFKKAAKVFLDEDRIESDLYYENSEYRYNVIGKIKDVVFVVCTDRKEDTIRLISARKATKREEAIYYGDCYYDS